MLVLPVPVEKLLGVCGRKFVIVLQTDIVLTVGMKNFGPLGLDVGRSFVDLHQDRGLCFCFPDLFAQS